MDLPVFSHAEGEPQAEQERRRSVAFRVGWWAGGQGLHICTGCRCSAERWGGSYPGCPGGVQPAAMAGSSGSTRGAATQPCAKDTSTDSSPQVFGVRVVFEVCFVTAEGLSHLRGSWASYRGGPACFPGELRDIKWLTWVNFCSLCWNISFFIKLVIVFILQRLRRTPRCFFIMLFHLSIPCTVGGDYLPALWLDTLWSRVVPVPVMYD